MTSVLVRKCIQDYLSCHALSKVACITNISPKRHDPLIKGKYINYVCFCVLRQKQRSEILDLAYRYGLKTLEYDVIVASPEECLKIRQFGYLDFQLDNVDRANDLLRFVIENKKKINRQYSILIRLRCEGLAGLKLADKATIKGNINDDDGVFEIQ